MRAVLQAGLVVAAVAWSTGAGAQPGVDACRPGVKFRGQRIDLDVRGADVRAVFRLLADAGSVNVVLSDNVTGAVTLRVKRIPWDELLCTVARAKHLRVSRAARVYLVVPMRDPG